MNLKFKRFQKAQIVFLVALFFQPSYFAVANETFSWDDMEKLRNSIVVPEFPDRDFSIAEFGAIPDGTTDSSEAIRAAIEACSKAGGGRVVVTGGTFKTGPIHLKSNVNLHVDHQSTLSFYTDADKYLPAVLTRYEGVEVMGYSPLIYAYGETNIAVTGKGVLDGAADDSNWWKMTPPKLNQLDQEPDHTKLQLFEMAEKGIPVAERNFGLSSKLRPSFIEPYACRNVLIEDITIINAPFWMIHPVLSKNVTVRGVTCSSAGPNNDGCDPESSENVLIEDCVFNTKDDGVAIKAGRNADGRRINKPSRNIIISNCEMNTRHTAVALGSEMSGGIENVYIENLTCSLIQRVFRIKTNSMRGGFVRHVGMRNVTIEQADGTLIDVSTTYGKELGDFPPDIEDVTLSNISCQRSKQALSIKGSLEMPIKNIRLADIQVAEFEKESVFDHVHDLAIRNLQIGTANN